MAMSDDQLRAEECLQCRIHDRGVDRYDMGHPVIEDAQRRLNIVHAEMKRRGLDGEGIVE